MSRGGRVQIVRPTAAEACAQVVAELAAEMAPACSQAMDFFVGGIRDFLTAPVAEAASEYEAVLRREGARCINVALPELARKHEELRYAILNNALQLQVAVPDVLTAPADVVSAMDVQLQEEALAQLQRAAASGTVAALDFSSIEQQLAAGRDDLAQAIAGAQLAAARHITPEEPLFGAVEQILTAVDGGARGEITRQIAEWESTATQSIAAEVREGWTALVLAAAQLSAKDAGLTDISLDLSGGRLTARESTETEQRIEVSVVPEVNQLNWELHGYEGGACKPVEAAFLSALERYLGVQLDDNKVVSFDTQASAPNRPVSHYSPPEQPPAIGSSTNSGEDTVLRN